MHNMIFLSRKTFAVGATALLLSTSSCSFFETEAVTDPNSPSIESVITNATQAQINALGVGVEASLRLGHTSNAPNNWVVGTFGREVVVLATNESRWYTELLGSRSAILDDAAYYNAAYTDFSRVGRAARIFRESANGTAVLNAAQKSGVAGFTHTYEALSKLQVLILQGGEGSTDATKGGIRIDLDNYLKPGKFVSYTESLANIRQLLDQGASELDAAGTSFGFQLSTGYAGFSTPADFKKFNRALAARVSLYQKNYAASLTALNESFYSRTAALTLGPKITFNPGNAGDQGNPYFQVPNSTVAQLVTVPDNFVTEAETGDTRVSKVALRTAPRSLTSAPRIRFADFAAGHHPQRRAAADCRRSPRHDERLRRRYAGHQRGSRGGWPYSYGSDGCQRDRRHSQGASLLAVLRRPPLAGPASYRPPADGGNSGWRTRRSEGADAALQRHALPSV